MTRERYLARLVVQYRRDARTMVAAGRPPGSRFAEANRLSALAQRCAQGLDCNECGTPVPKGQADGYPGYGPRLCPECNARAVPV